MKIYDIILALYLFNLISNAFNATLFIAVDSYNVSVGTQIPTQGLDPSNIGVQITELNKSVPSVGDVGLIDGVWGGIKMIANSMKFLLELFIYPSGITAIMTKLLPANPMFGAFINIFYYAISLIMAFCLYMLLFNRNSKWME